MKSTRRSPNSILEHSKFSNAPIFIMTSHYSIEGEKDALLLGASGYLKKPLDFEQLCSAFEKANSR